MVREKSGQDKELPMYYHWLWLGWVFYSHNLSTVFSLDAPTIIIVRM